MSPPRVQLFILSRDRPVYLRETLHSALRQEGSGLDIVVSDNSEGDAVQAMLRDEFPQVRCIRRWPCLPALTHFNTLIQEASAEYVVLFHDDDVLEPDYVLKMRQSLEQHPECVAVACNARVIQQDTLTDKTMMGFVRQDQWMASPVDLLQPYMRLMGQAPAPFPGYMYRTRHLHGLGLIASEGGKFADVSFLVKLAARGPILWRSDCLMQYRVHDANDGLTEVVGQRLRLLRFIYNHTDIRPGSALVQEFRFRYWLRWWRGASGQRAHQSHPQRVRVVRRYLIGIGLRLVLTRPGMWLRYLAKVRP